MCGLVALITKGKYGFNKVEQKMFSELLYADALRGYDATGVIGVCNDGDYHVMKEASEASYFLPYYNASDLDKDMFKKGAAVIGHNRAKTIGENKDENAHPFVVEETFAMVHNGTLRNHKELANTTVDSEALAIVFKAAMDEEDYVQAISEVVWKVQGAFACIWFDQKRNQIGVIRNNQRPLGFVELAGSVIISSEMMLVNWIANRNNEKITSFKAVPENTLCIFDLTKGGASFTEFPLSRPPVKSTTLVTPIGTGNITQTPTKSYTGNSGVVVRCSKNAFKRMKRQIEGRTITFCLDDWVEKHLHIPGDEYMILGSSVDGAYDLCEVMHTIRAPINIKSLGMSVKELDFQAKWTGRITNMEFEDKTGQILIDVVATMPVLEEYIHEIKH